MRLKTIAWVQRTAISVACLAAVITPCGWTQCEPTEIQIVDGTDFSPGGYFVRHFGWSCAADGSRVLFGAPTSFQNGSSSNSQGSAHVYDLTPGSLTPVTHFTSPVSPPPTNMSVSRFGNAVGVDGDVIAVGAPGFASAGWNGTGAVFIFEFSAGAWAQTAALTAPPQLTQVSDFGQILSLAGGRLLVGVPNHSGNRGAVVVFERLSGSWVNTAVITAADGATGDNFGQSLGVDGGLCAIGSPGDDTTQIDQGSVYVFELFGSVWFQTTKIVGSPGVAGASLGRSVALEGSCVAASRYELVGQSASGAVEVYRRKPSGWVFEQLLTPLIGPSFGFGDALDLTHARLAVLETTSPSWGGTEAADIYEYSGSTWSISARAHKATATSSGHPSIAQSDTRLILGSPGEQNPNNLNISGRGRLMAAVTGELIQYGSGCHGGGGPIPTLNMSGCAVPTGQLHTEIGGALGGSIGVLLLGAGQAAINVGGGCLLQIAPTLPPVVTIPLFGVGAGQGSISFTAALPANVPVVSFTMQAFCADPSAPLGFSVTNGVELSVE